jgi:uncharacterized protein with HEPN domain
VKAEPQASVAVATANTGVAGQSIVEFAGKAAITGAVLSCTLIVCEAVDELPHESVAVQVLVIEYEPAHEPLVVTSAEVNVKAEPQASVAVATANTGVAGQSIVEFVGKAAITGAVLSCTLIVCEAVDELPHESVAVQVLVTEYEPAHEPLWLHLQKLT